jgi:hypothetical protein
LYQAASLLADTDLQDGFMTTYNEVTENGERVYSELNTGDWWRDAEEAKPEVCYKFSYVIRYVIFSVYIRERPFFQF